MSSKIIRIEPTEKYFSITWMLGPVCNYDCMYCPTEFHDSTSKPHDLELLQKVWINTYEKTKNKHLPYKISFTGGEVTANKSFLPFLKWLRTNYEDIKVVIITSNGSASLNYYQKICQYLEAISFSTHSEFMDEKAFFIKAREIDKLMIRPKKSFHVNIMNEFWNQDRIILYKHFLDDNKISYSVNEIDYSRKIRLENLTKGKSNIETI